MNINKNNKIEDFISYLKSRHLFIKFTNEEKVISAFRNKKAIYFGIDLTNNKLHLGHFLNINILKQISLLGNRVIFLLGAATSKIGDPTGKNKERPLLEEKTIDFNFKEIKKKINSLWKRLNPNFYQYYYKKTVSFDNLLEFIISIQNNNSDKVFIFLKLKLLFFFFEQINDNKKLKTDINLFFEEIINKIAEAEIKEKNSDFYLKDKNEILFLLNLIFVFYSKNKPNFFNETKIRKHILKLNKINNFLELSLNFLQKEDFLQKTVDLFFVYLRDELLFLNLPIPIFSFLVANCKNFSCKKNNLVEITEEVISILKKDNNFLSSEEKLFFWKVYFSKNTFLSDNVEENSFLVLKKKVGLFKTFLQIWRKVFFSIFLFTENYPKDDLLFLNNADWLDNLSLLNFLRSDGKLFTVDYLLKKESISSRIGKKGISYTEFSYNLLQAYDFFYLLKNKDCFLQIGGQDQWGNITSGIDFIRKKSLLQENKDLKNKAAGIILGLFMQNNRKFGKTTPGTFFLDETTKLLDYLLNLSDEESLVDLFRFTNLDNKTIKSLNKLAAKNKQFSLLQVVLAQIFSFYCADDFKSINNYLIMKEITFIIRLCKDIHLGFNKDTVYKILSKCDFSDVLLIEEKNNLIKDYFLNKESKIAIKQISILKKLILFFSYFKNFFKVFISTIKIIELIKIIEIEYLKNIIAKTEKCIFSWVKQKSIVIGSKIIVFEDLFKPLEAILTNGDYFFQEYKNKITKKNFLLLIKWVF